MKSTKKHFARKRFGQNFLVDTDIIAQIFSSLNINEDNIVLEIGPGLGALTEQLALSCNNLNLVEIDRDLAEKLRIKFNDKTDKTIKIFQQDILKFDLNTIYSTKATSSHVASTNAQTKTESTNTTSANAHLNHQKKIRVIGNLPYNISTPLIFKLLKDVNLIQDMHFMLQREVADRLSAVPGDKNYGRLSVMVQYSCKVLKLINVPAKAFKPAPKVQSAFVRLIPYSAPATKATNYDSFRFVTRLAFSHRRKTIYNALKNYIDKDLFLKLNINPTVRPEELQVSDFVKISNELDYHELTDRNKV